MSVILICLLVLGVIAVLSALQRKAMFDANSSLPADGFMDHFTGVVDLGVLRQSISGADVVVTARLSDGAEARTVVAEGERKVRKVRSIPLTHTFSGVFGLAVLAWCLASLMILVGIRRSVSKRLARIASGAVSFTFASRRLWSS